MENNISGESELSWTPGPWVDSLGGPKGTRSPWDPTGEVPDCALAGLESRMERHSPSSREERAGVQEICSDTLGAKKPTAGSQGRGAESSSALLACMIQPNIWHRPPVMCRAPKQQPHFELSQDPGLSGSLGR